MADTLEGRSRFQILSGAQWELIARVGLRPPLNLTRAGPRPPLKGAGKAMIRLAAGPLSLMMSSSWRP